MGLKKFGAAVIGRQVIGFPGSVITAVEPTSDYLGHGPVGDGWLEGGRAVTTDFWVTVRLDDGRDIELPKSWRWITTPTEGTCACPAPATVTD